MNLDNCDDRINLVTDLFNYAKPIIDSISKEPGFDIDDWCNLLRLREKLHALRILMVTENNFGYALYKMYEIRTSEEDSKWTFPLEKAYSDFMQHYLLRMIDSLVDVSRSWKFNDYRARNFQNDLRQKMEMLRDWYKETL